MCCALNRKDAETETVIYNLRELIQQERAKYQKERIGNKPFNAAWWLRGKLNVLFEESLFQKQSEEKEEKGDFFYALRGAWDLVAYEQLDGEHSETVYGDINGCIHVFNNYTLSLSPLGVTLLDAMAEALDIPHTPGQDTFDISFFSSTAAFERVRKGALYRYPSLEEVRNATTHQAVDSTLEQTNEQAEKTQENDQP